MVMQDGACRAGQLDLSLGWRWRLDGNFQILTGVFCVFFLNILMISSAFI